MNPMILPTERMKPAKTIVPVVGLDETLTFLGTGAFVGQQTLLVTCDHVVENWNKPFAIAILPEGHPGTCDIYQAKLVARNPNADLALLEVTGYSPKKVLELAQDDEIRSNHPIVCLEYSTTHARAEGLYFEPATRLGNVTRRHDLKDIYGQAGEAMLELSFPALRGASGAPVLSNINHRLWGIVKGNVAHHLLPVQIERVWDEEGKITEETRFLLPQAVAVHVKHLRAMLQELA
jgi:S1-C subfamily serine protease